MSHVTRSNPRGGLGELPPDNTRQTRIARPPLKNINAKGQWVNDVRFTQIGLVTTLLSAQYAPAAFGRRYLLIQNKGTSGIYVAIDSTVASSFFNGIFIDAGGNYEPWVIPNGSINIIGVAANIPCVIVEGF